MKKYFLTVLFDLSAFAAVACEVCEKQQPKLLRGLVHGGVPQGPTDYVAVYIMIAITIATLFYSVKLLWKPGEKSKTHIKHFILNDE